MSQPVRITITLDGSLDPAAVKAEAFGFAVASAPGDENTEQAAAALAGSLRASSQVLVMAADVGKYLEEWLPSFAADAASLEVTVDAPGLGPEDGGQHLVRTDR